jgi:hypothetical protein
MGFWDNTGQWGPGLFNTVAGLYTSNEANKEAEERMRRAQGPMYDTVMGASANALSLAGNMDPKAHAAERFNAQQELLAPGNEREENTLMRKLHAKGLLGVASFDPVPGTKPTPGVALNPYMAAMMAAREGAKAKSAYDALGEGEKYLDRLLDRSGQLERRAQTARSTGQRALQTIPSRSAQTLQLLQGLGGVAKDMGLFGELGKWLGGGSGLSPDAIPAPAGGWDSPEISGLAEQIMPSFELPRFEMPNWDDFNYGGYSADDWGWGW